MLLDMEIEKSNEQVLNVLLIKSETGDSHYVLIKDFNRLMYSKTKHKYRKHFCMACLQNFTTKEILNKHREQCLLINNTQAAKYETGIIVPIPVKIYADIECLLKRIDPEEGRNTKLYQKHIPIIFHNLEGCDVRIIFRELRNFKDLDIQVIPKSNERFMSIIINNSILFLDSLQFCKASLDALAENLKDNDFKH